MSYTHRVADWKTEALILELRSVRLREKAIEARKGGHIWAAIAYIKMAGCVSEDAEHAHAFAKRVKKIRTPNQIKVVLG